MWQIKCFDWGHHMCTMFCRVLISNVQKSDTKAVKNTYSYYLCHLSTRLWSSKLWVKAETFIFYVLNIMEGVALLDAIDSWNDSAIIGQLHWPPWPIQLRHVVRKLSLWLYSLQNTKVVDLPSLFMTKEHFTSVGLATTVAYVATVLVVSYIGGM